ncbi:MULTISPECIES: flagellar basal body P-ring protein FlgI [Methylobacterium]|jgi:flagellar P-ring protein precursor FlgI|uniref:flagellar basal body P-ring protein FlgI n=1 Tax=Methylobacterium TaxID=407 RepID=UPI0008E5914D|nr:MULTISPECIES: flagellar basal body P-ring protein FlgI [Methylobacterium]MBK3396287.1 flagellar basal body P-ring protein FlgI [Methylobacterium ajmalii]MBK3412246.1 flagellar basal body P-ring protein FlgI [Methylobacterium ajmalii]MBK3420970.1 flagellar basal body P-ring protein FlgI [Methylobacterium ajmalii]MBZ6415154.1 flagellar basal body P-ring protein FlgI [Methylobacterium sp.]SFF59550.1 flagellar P-ring protein precursor FlgI [Methylobacterium sp. yr596]
MRAGLRAARVVLGLLALGSALAAPAVPAFAVAPVIAGGGYARIKDVASLKGVRDNQIVGYGLVTGLQGTGDTLRNAQFTEQSLQSMLDRMGINVRDARLRTRNVAAVMVTADLPPYVGAGSRIDVTVTSLGDATSLRGGTLLMTPLSGGDGNVYAAAQGPLAVSGFSAQGQAEQLTQGVPTAGRIPNGALIEREVPGAFRDLPELIFELKNPDFKTATMVADAINAYAMGRFHRRIASPRDQRSVVLQRPRDMILPRLVAEIGDLTIQPDVPARVVVDQRTGTVVIGRNVQISTVAVTHGNLTVRVTETPEVSQPAPFSNGQTTVVPRTEVAAREEQGKLAVLGGSDLQTLVRGLNQVGLKPTDIIAILQAVKTAGALQAELVVQ